jgi:hypothetical protein
MAKMSEAERELYAMLAEEAAEVAQACMKILRWGSEGSHPSDPGTTNAELLSAEVEDFLCVADRMSRLSLIAVDRDPERLSQRWYREKHRWTNHQTLSIAVGSWVLVEPVGRCGTVTAVSGDRVTVLVESGYTIVVDRSKVR